MIRRKKYLTPERLAEKLRSIRLALGLSQNELIRYLDVELVLQSDISNYEIGRREPPLVVLLRYARAANISTDMLIDDEIDLPAKLPAKSKRAR